MQVEDHFEIVVSPDTYGVGKPDPAIFTRTIAAMNLMSSEVLYVGDSYDFDVIGARTAGITPALIDRFGLQIQEHRDAEHRLTSLEQLHEVLARSSASSTPSEVSSA
jgi:putative hydrolase of the HAD superfamily